jgi:hypothetical protein
MPFSIVFAFMATKCKEILSRNLRMKFLSYGLSNLTGFFESCFLSAREGDSHYFGLSEEDGTNPAKRNCKSRATEKALDQAPKPVRGFAEG